MSVRPMTFLSAEVETTIRALVKAAGYRLTPAGEIRIPAPPRANAEHQQLRHVCKCVARAQGKTGRQRDIETSRLYLDAIAEAARQVREPGSVHVVQSAPVVDGHVVAAVPQPEGAVQTPGGLWVPGA